MKVSLVDHTINPERKIAEYSAICYDADISEEACARRMEKLLNLGHLATLRFASATFKIEGISRACSHQFVRAKHLDFLQESQRYVDQENTKFIWPESIPEIVKSWYEDEIMRDYNILIADGIRKEDARYILPNAVSTKLYVTGNFQAWKDFLKNRTDKAAQWEIRNVALGIQKQLAIIAPNIFGDKNG